MVCDDQPGTGASERAVSTNAQAQHGAQSPADEARNGAVNRPTEFPRQRLKRNDNPEHDGKDESQKRGAEISHIVRLNAER